MEEARILKREPSSGLEALASRPIHLYYGNRVGEILGARDRILAAWLDPETRDENLTEYRSTKGQFFAELTELLPEIAGDLDTISFIPGSRKVAVVVNPIEVYSRSGARKRAGGAKRKAETASEVEDGQAAAGLRWLAEVLPKTDNRLLLLAFEEESESREIDDKSPLFQLIARIGAIRPFRHPRAFYRIEDALIDRDATACLRAVRDLWGDGKGDNSVYSGLTRSLRFMLQANINLERGVTKDPVRAERLLPSRAQFNLFKSQDFIRKKYTRSPLPYRTSDLLTAYEGLVKVYRAMRPDKAELYVPDSLMLVEKVLMELFASPPPPARR